MDDDKIGLRYKDFEIIYYPKPIPIRSHDWEAVHDDYDGCDDGEYNIHDHRFFTAGSVDDLKIIINEWYEEQGDHNTWNVMCIVD